MGVYSDPNLALLSAVSAEGTGQAFDARGFGSDAYMFYKASGESAIFNLEVSHDATAWMIVATYTATATQSASAQFAAKYYPWVRGNVVELYTATGAGGTATGVLWVNYHPSVK